MILIAGTAEPTAHELKELFTYIKANKAETYLVGDLKGIESIAYAFGQILDASFKRFNTDWNVENALTKRNEKMLKELFDEPLPKIAVIGTNLSGITERLMLKALLAGAENVKIGENHVG